MTFPVWYWYIGIVKCVAVWVGNFWACLKQNSTHRRCCALRWSGQKKKTFWSPSLAVSPLEVSFNLISFETSDGISQHYYAPDAAVPKLLQFISSQTCFGDDGLPTPPPLLTAWELSPRFIINGNTIAAMGACYDQTTKRESVLSIQRCTHTHTHVVDAQWDADMSLSSVLWIGPYNQKVLCQRNGHCIYFFVNIWEYFSCLKTQIGIQYLFNWLWLVMKAPQSIHIACANVCMSVQFDVNKK